MNWDAPELYLAVSVVGIVFTMTALIRARQISAFVAPWFFASWITSELALYHVAWQAAATLVFAVAGAFGAWQGWLGLGLTLLSWAGLAVAWRQSHEAAAVFETALVSALGGHHRDDIPEERKKKLREHVPRGHLLRPFSFKRPAVERIRNIPYADAGKRNLLDIYKPVEPGSGRPVLLQIHGGGWVIGQKDQQGLPLMNHLAEHGWVCVAVNYRLSPSARFPEHLIDIKRAMAWIRAHIAEHGGDPNWVAVTATL